MLVFWRQRLVLLATPKTGTTAIETALESVATIAIVRPPELKHTGAQKYRRFLAPYLERTAGEPFTVVAVMREPIDWLGSWYRYLQRDKMRGTSRDTSSVTFDAFVGHYLADQRPDFADIGSQARFLSHEGRIAVDRIFCYEDMGTLVAYLEDRLNQQIVLPRVNVSPLAATQLSSETEQRLRKDYARDFRLYDKVRNSSP